MSDLIGWAIAIALVVGLWGGAFWMAADPSQGGDRRSGPRDGRAS